MSSIALRVCVNPRRSFENWRGSPDENSLGDWIGCEARSAGVKTGDAAIGHLQATRWQK